MKVGYIRVSSISQNTERQELSLKNIVDKLYIEKASGKTSERKILQEMLEYIRDGDEVIVTEFSRLARNVKDLLTITDTITSKGASFKSIKENLDTSTPSGKMMLTIIGAIAEFERDVLLQRQREGIEVAKQKGKFKKQSLPIPKDFKEKLLEYEHNKSNLAKHYIVSRPTIYNWLKSVKSTLWTHIQYVKILGKQGHFTSLIK